jgi:hypothetical protein
MADPTLNVSIQMFEDIYLKTYQRKEKLAGTSLVRNGVKGDAYKWPKLGNAEMGDRGAYSSIVPPADLDHQFTAITTFEDKVLRVRLDKGEESLTNADERSMWANILAAAYGRQRDQWKLEALDNATNSVPVGTSNLTVAKLRAAKRILWDNEADSADDGLFYLACAPSQIESLLGEEEVTSADYNTIRALVNGNVDTFMGFKFIRISDKNTIGKLPKTGNNRTCYAWTKSALGAVYKMQPGVTAYYERLLFSYVADSRVIGGASLLQDDGAVKIICDES